MGPDDGGVDLDQPVDVAGRVRAGLDLLGRCPAPLLRDPVDDVDGVRVIYYVTALRQITIVAYVEA